MRRARICAVALVALAGCHRLLPYEAGPDGSGRDGPGDGPRVEGLAACGMAVCLPGELCA